MCRWRHCEQSRTEAFATSYEGGITRATQTSILYNNYTILLASVLQKNIKK